MRNAVGLCVAIVLGAATAQGQTMADRKMTPATTYAGCVERTDTGTFALTHAMRADAAAGTVSKKPAMAAHDGMADGMKDTMKEPMKDGMKSEGDRMMSSTLQLFTKSVDLTHHVGQKVRVTGTEDDSMAGMTMFAVKSLKVVAGSCR